MGREAILLEFVWNRWSLRTRNGLNMTSPGSSVLGSLKNKMPHLRDELDKYKDMYDEKCQELDDEKNKRNEAEGEVQALTRRIRLLEEDFEQTETRLTSATEKLEEASKAADESERGRKALEQRSMADEERISQLETMVKEVSEAANESERKYEV